MIYAFEHGSSSPSFIEQHFISNEHQIRIDGSKATAKWFYFPRKMPLNGRYYSVAHVQFH